METIVAALHQLQSPGDFCTRLSLAPDDLSIAIGGAAPLTFPLRPTAARALIAQARPARFGWRDQTLQDAQVRDTWEIPKSRVKIDKRRWNKTLHPLLDQVKAQLGLEPAVKLSASLHNLLIYEEGQFFAPHQDTEKEQGMVATLVVIRDQADAGSDVLAWLLNFQFERLVERDAGTLEYGTPVSLAGRSAERMQCASEFLRACLAAEQPEMLCRQVDHLLDNDQLYPPLALAQMLVPMSRAKKVEAILPASDKDTGVAWGLQRLIDHVIGELNAALAKAQRQPDDWSIEQAARCSCADCAELNRFLKASPARQKVWPLAQHSRSHIHQTVDDLGVPVTHETRREGRPYKLVLIKTNALFEHEQRDRDRVSVALARLVEQI